MAHRIMNRYAAGSFAVRGGGAGKHTNNTRRGGELEKLVMLSQSDVQGRVVVLEHIRNFAKRIPSATGGTMLIEQASPFDFAGTCFHSGRAICFDAKRISTASFQVNNPKLVKTHQIDALERQHHAGAISGLLVWSERMHDFRWLPADRIRRDSRIRWEDGAWIVIGADTKLIQFRTLINAVEGR